ncbi:hypothetical protein HELRODRAFT_194364 [Helobdella robusta]|uniref:J domain-containing protein n=1 Tax=Helobdella robusta TaxID=6412 RepID=T1FVZ7_HELRO|nr:hypothetical protein HELRODRAFT_194364 [Helobdella robusta]ESN92232.1 hypothetical protein HELRODRAFT_194364 [Helobdella robusta]
MANSDESDFDLEDEDDYYAWLGLNRSASADEINNAYRRLSRMYHPDKHQSDDKKQKAAQLFNKIKRAHEVLSDSHQKAIYDVAGVQGLKTEGWQLQVKYRTPQEILDEYERLKKENEEKKLQQRTNPKGSLTIGINATDIFDGYDYDSEYSSLLPSVEISDMQISQSVECPLTGKDTVTLSGHLSSHNGTGQGNVSIATRRVLSDKGWGEVEFSMGSKPSLSCRGFRTLWNRGFGTVGGSLQLGPDGMPKVNYNLMVAHQFDKHLHGRLTFNGGLLSGVNASLMYDRDDHHALLGLQLGIPATYAILQYIYNCQKYDLRLKTALRFGTFGFLFEYGCTKKVTQFSDLGASISFGVPVGVSLKIRLTRGNQTFSMPIRLSESVVPSAIFYGTLVPLVGYFMIKKFIIDPYVKEQNERNLKEKKQKHTELFSKKKKEAEDAMDLMSEQVERCREVEENIGGLVIHRALYGVLVDEGSGSCCIEVGRCLQGLVKNSKLLVIENTKLSDLPGFYDPSFGETKSLLVEYSFGGRRHRHVFIEGERIVLPNKDHIID